MPQTEIELLLKERMGLEVHPSIALHRAGCGRAHGGMRREKAEEYAGLVAGSEEVQELIEAWWFPRRGSSEIGRRFRVARLAITEWLPAIRATPSHVEHSMSER